MVSSVGSNPYYSYLNTLQTPAAAATTTAGTSSGAGSSTSATGQSLVSSLLGGGYVPETLSLLQQNGSNNFDPITDLLGGTGTNSATTDLYSNLYDSVEAAALTSAQEGNATPNGTTPTTGTSSGSGSSAPSFDPVQSLINAQTQASIAYNQTIQQNVANTVKSIVQA